MQGTVIMNSETDLQAALAVQKLLGENTTNGAGAPPQNAQEIISQKTLCVSVHFRRFGVERKIASEAVEVDMDKSRLRAGKRILIAPELDEIISLDGRVTKYLRSRSLSAPLQAGWFLIPLELVEEVDQELQSFKAQREQLVEKLIEAYPKRILESREALKSQYNAADYPAAPVLRHIFKMEIQYHVTSDVPGSIASVSQAIWQRESKKMAKKCESMLEEVEMGLKAGLFQLVKHLAERLGYIGEGKKKTFKDTTVTNLVDFLGVFDKLNITGNQDLAQLVTQARELVKGVKSPDELRKNTDLRDTVRTGMEAIVKQMEPMMVDMPKRFFDL